MIYQEATRGLKKMVKTIPMLVFWAITVFLSILLIHNAVLYFTHGGEYGILPEKLEARKDWLWNIAFYLHLPAGIACLALPWVGFARKLAPIAKTLHASAGKAYVRLTLFIVCPTGMYLALYAKGGMLTASGFLLQGLLLGWHTTLAARAAASGDYKSHVQQMIRSYSVALVVLTFRVLHIGFFLLQVPYYHNYAISQWLGLSLNLLIAESIIAFSSRNFSTHKHPHYESHPKNDGIVSRRPWHRRLLAWADDPRR